MGNRHLTMDRDKHKPDCINPHALTSHIMRVGKKFVTYGTFCMSCETTERTNFSDIFNSKQRRARAINIDRKFTKKETQDFENTTGIEFHALVCDDVSCHILKLITPKRIESKLKSLGRFYKTVSRKLRLKEDLGWDPKLCKRFLASKPTINQLMIAFAGPKLDWIYSCSKPRERSRYIGCILSYKRKSLWRVTDRPGYIEALKAEIKERNEFMALVALKVKRARRKKKLLPELPA